MAARRQFGNIRKLPSGRFQARYDRGSGEVVTAPKTFESRRDADRWLALEHARHLGSSWSNPVAGDVLLRDFAEDWLASRSMLKPRTRALYRDLLTRFITSPVTRSTATVCCPDLGDFRLKDVTPGHVDRWYRWVLEASEEAALRRQMVVIGSPAWRRSLRQWAIEQGLIVSTTGRLPEYVQAAWERAGSPPLAVGRVRPVEKAGRAQSANAYKLLRGIMGAAVEGGLVAANPCKVRNGSASPRSQNPAATPRELAVIANAMFDRYQAAVLVAAYGALRAGEVFGLARRHIDLVRGAVTIERSVNYLPGRGRTFGAPKTEAGQRRVHLPEAVVQALATHMDHYVAASPDALVFGTSRGTPLHSSNRTAIFRRAAQSAGRPDMRFHDLRQVESIALVYDDTGERVLLDAGAVTA